MIPPFGRSIFRIFGGAQQKTEGNPRDIRAILSHIQE